MGHWSPVVRRAFYPTQVTDQTHPPYLTHLTHLTYLTYLTYLPCLPSPLSRAFLRAAPQR